MACSRGHAWQVPIVQLHLRRLLLSAQSVLAHAGCPAQRHAALAAGSSTVDTGGIRKPPRSGNGYAVSESIGEVFGCTLGNLLTYARGNKHTLKVARDRMELILGLSARR